MKTKLNDFAYTAAMQYKHLLLASIALSFTLSASDPKSSYLTDQPDYCRLLQPVSPDRLSLPDWVLGSGSALKRQGCWKSHIYWGQKALAQLADKKESDQQRSLLLSLASSYFYLGDYEHCLELARKAEALSTGKKHWRERVEALYLRSAVARVRQQKDAVALAEQALALLDQQQDESPFLKGKVFYNLAAALTDGVEVNLSRAGNVLEQAETLFRQSGSQYDVTRTVIRRARVDHLQEHYDSALARLNSIQFQLESPRTRMLFFQQRAKVLLALQEWQRARKDIEKAQDLALALDAKADLSRINQLQKQVQLRRKRPLSNQG